MSELTVASFNLHWGLSGRRGGYRPFDVVGACAQIDADVLVLQESWTPDDGVAQHDQVADALGYGVLATSLARASVTPTPRIASRPDPERRKGDGDWCLALLTRPDVIDASVLPLRRLPTDPAARSVIRAVVELDGRPLAVHGTHMAHLEMGVACHTRGLRAALEPASMPGVLLGDMNMWGWCISAMTPKGWTRAGGGPTFSVARPFHRIDHLVTNDQVELMSSEVLPDLGSDHLAIRGRIRLREVGSR